MKVIRFDFSFFLELLKYIFIPVVIVVIVTGIAIAIYSSTIKEKDIKRYNYVVGFWSCLLAIVIIGALTAITIGFSKSLTDSMVAYDLVANNRMFYNIVKFLPLFPIVFLILYIGKFVRIVLHKAPKPKELEKELKKVQEKRESKEQEVGNKVETEKKEIKEETKIETKSKDENSTDILPEPSIVLEKADTEEEIEELI